MSSSEVEHDEESERDIVKMFIGVHIGAGFIKEQNETKYQALMKNALGVAMNVLKATSDSDKSPEGERIEASSSAEDAVVAAMQLFEESGIVNCGRGSNLTADGIVECDASIVYTKSEEKMLEKQSKLNESKGKRRERHFASIGAVRGVSNPSMLALDVARKAEIGLMSHGRIPPRILVGQGALEWAKEFGSCKIVSPESMRSSQSILRWKRYRDIVYGSGSPPEKKRKGNNQEINKRRTDPFQESNIYSDASETVGAVCLDRKGNLCAAVSSGGLHLQRNGRVGHAGVYGAGCWVTLDTLKEASKGNVQCATSVSGCGEALIEFMLAKTCCRYAEEGSDNYISDVLNKTVETYPAGSPLRNAGLISLRIDPSKRCLDFSWTRNTKVFAVGFMSNLDQEPTTVIDRGAVSSSKKCFNI